MTQLYRLDADAAAIARHFEAWAGNDPWQGGYIAPGQFAPVITAGREFIAGPRKGRGQHRMIPRIWGVPPPPSAHDATRGITSVRNVDSPFWIGNLRNSEFRCLVPATSFMEWGAGIDVEGRRNRHHFRCSDQEIFAFAGVWKDSEIPTFAILTCPANQRLRAIGREVMPVILPPDSKAEDLWLHGGWDKACELLKPCPEDILLETNGIS
ncbi:SOS response-associated peptidase family protein [Alteraurantiacibacter aquimixticola]|uniref:Abasic site processing protein n=1 Tax=Alteraurantiacibacter aquimixticola TaxID=2489173 RepID=A0A4T3F1C4_9SPHN|nr:SOS response-associated peptidase family protein [Alteraurantiacibacter aquimixticola]TIX49737.1 DUF159 family protein [Alteraurantiacibacter aquimixticola]